MQFRARSIALRALPGIALAAPSIAQGLPAPTAFTTEWRMTGATAEFLDKIGGPGTIEYGDGAGGMTSMLDSFTTTSAAGIPNIQGVDTPILHFGRHVQNTTGYQIRPLTTVDAMQFTMVWDLFLEVGNPDSYQGLWNGSATNANDSELHLEITTGGFPPVSG
ncbi:MAG: hypothetical protein GY711_19520 [bacterium]|nr:hypothetical protein [bacterium]